MCKCKCIKSEETKPARPAEPPPILWEEEVAKRTEGKLPPGYHIEHHRWGRDDKTGTVVSIDTRGSYAVGVVYKDTVDSWGFESYRASASLLVRKAWKNFLKQGY